MRTSTQFTVSVQILLLVAASKGRKLTSDSLSQSTGSNPVMVRQLFGKMKRAGLLEVSAGKGSILLARSPAEITLWDVFSAVECGGWSNMIAFHPKLDETCGLGGPFRRVMAAHLDKAVLALRKSLERVTLARLSREISRLGRGEIPEG